jgi:hypothetical protein
VTADRAWVKATARWIARIDSVQGHLGLAFQAMSGVGIASGALKYFGMSQFVAPFIVLVAVGVLGFAYLYSEGGVWNQVSRDRSDMSSNFATPRDVIDDTLIATGVFAAQNGRPPDEHEMDVIHEAVRGQWEEFRDGIDLEDTEDATQGVPSDD